MDALQCRLLIGRAGISAAQLRTALHALAGPEADGASLPALLGHSPATLRAVGLPDRAVRLLQRPPLDALTRDRLCLERTGVTLIDTWDAHYPPLLGATADAPAVLYVRGELDSLRRPQLALVGARLPTAAGRRVAHDFAAELTTRGLVITSGLASGIDSAGHEGALAAGGRTLAVLGAGLDLIYPREHERLAARIVSRGALVSEYPPGTAPRRAHFPRRNRLIAGLSLGTLVIEAARHSGSLLTARLAGEYGRAVFAVPGSILNPLARGCHALIRSGARLVEDAADVLAEIRIPVAEHQVTESTPPRVPNAPGPCVLDKEYKILLDALGFEATGIDSLVQRTGFPSHSVASMLLVLELEGAVGLQAGGRYMRLPPRLREQRGAS